MNLTNTIYMGMWLRKYSDYLLLAGVLCFAALFASANHFIQDDAYITFRYAQHFAQGYGLVWSPGSDEYGYTSFLFTLLVGLLMKAGADPQTAAFMISVPAWFGAIAFTFLMARLVSNSLYVPIVSSVALATHYTFSAYATGGLETSLQTCLVLGVYYHLIRWHRFADKSDLDILSVLATLALLTRLDSALLLFPAYGFLAYYLLANRGAGLNIFLMAAFIPTLAVLALLNFSMAYYGYPFPNSFYAKISSQSYLPEGLQYFAEYVKAQAYVPVILVVLCALRMMSGPLRRAQGGIVLLWTGPIILWVYYLLYIGGDFMEFRMLVPILPFFYLIACRLLIHGNTRFRQIMTAVALMLVIGYGNVSARSFKGEALVPESISSLNHWLKDEPNNWIHTGKILHKLFYTGQPGDVKIAVTASGAIPYYSDLPTFDQFGLNTREALLTGFFYNARPGHRIKADWGDVRAQGVNLLLDQPTYICAKASARCINTTQTSQVEHDLFIPLDNSCYLKVQYQKSHLLIDALIQENKILTAQQLDPAATCKK